MKQVMVALCAALMLTSVACGGGSDGSGGRADNGNDTDNNDDTDNDSPEVCDVCQVDTLATGFGECLDNCRNDCPEQFSECRDACLDECDGCGTGLSCLYSGDDERQYRCGPKNQITTCDGVDYGDGL